MTYYPSGSSFTFHCFLDGNVQPAMNFLKRVMFVWGVFFCGHCALHMTVLVKSAYEYLKASLTALLFLSKILKAGTRKFRKSFRMGLPDSIEICPRKADLALFLQRLRLHYIHQSDAPVRGMLDVLVLQAKYFQ